MKQLALLSSLFLVSCASVSVNEVERKNIEFNATNDSSLCYIPPKDASFAGNTYPNSGMAISGKVLAAIPQGIKVIEAQSPEECDADNMLTVDILHYENRATGWSGLPDRLRLKLELTEIPPGKTNQLVYSSQSEMVSSAMFEWGNAAPYKLLGKDFKKQVHALFGQ